jgi:hypothetical protein
MRNYDEDIRKAKERLKKLEEQKAQQEIRMYVTIGKACVAVFGDSLVDMKQKDVETFLKEKISGSQTEFTPSQEEFYDALNSMDANSGYDTCQQ